jgi:hypothetical protein
VPRLLDAGASGGPTLNGCLLPVPFCLCHRSCPLADLRLTSPSARAGRWCRGGRCRSIVIRGLPTRTGRTPTWRGRAGSRARRSQSSGSVWPSVLPSRRWSSEYQHSVTLRQDGPVMIPAPCNPSGSTNLASASKRARVMSRSATASGLSIVTASGI